jgi:hypothetical protein
MNDGLENGLKNQALAIKTRKYRIAYVHLQNVSSMK